MKFVPLSIHLQTIAELYEKCAQLSQQLHEQNSKTDQDAKSTNENTQLSESIEIDEIQNVSPKSQIIQTKDNIKQNIKKIKSQNNQKVQNQCSDCNQVYEVKVKKKSKKHKHINKQKTKKSRQLVKQLRQQQQQSKQFEIDLNERTNSENSKINKNEIMNNSILENQDKIDDIQNQDSQDEFEISL
ncbi:unnamed protein product [Paramecium primaurelia]|uniref:Uncharacterized protein n=1 Tax=Paramecium primaurelia TaxID=5886 RepID=A0A8S1NSP9_PARPR|nr:unnamed protein product [Paramecium primaurelia]